MSFKNAAVLLVMIAAAGCKSTGSYGHPDRGAPFLRPTGARPAVAGPEAAAAVLRERVVEVNPLRLSPPQNQRIELPLFDDTRLEAVGVRTERRGKGFVWIGQLRDGPLSLVVLSVQGDAVAGNGFTDRGDNYEIRPVGRGLPIVRQLDPSTPWRWRRCIGSMRRVSATAFEIRRTQRVVATSGRDLTECWSKR